MPWRTGAADSDFSRPRTSLALRVGERDAIRLREHVLGLGAPDARDDDAPQQPGAGAVVKGSEALGVVLLDPGRQLAAIVAHALCWVYAVASARLTAPGMTGSGAEVGRGKPIGLREVAHGCHA